MKVLDQLIAEAGERAARLPMPLATPQPVPADRANFRQAVAGRDRIHVISEFKRASPSRGAIRPNASVVEMVTAYQEGGASALSVLTEPSMFSGNDIDVKLAAAAVDLPILMKDFVVSPRQIEHAVTLGASAILLIVCCLEPSRLLELAQTSRELGLSTLVECHDEAEIELALQVEDGLIGINQRNLKEMTIDAGRGLRLLQAVPDDRVVVVESGVENPEQIRALHGLADAVLVGTALMCSRDPRRFLTDALRPPAAGEQA